MSNCCDRFVMIEGEEDSFETWQGLRGPYYTPSVSEDGTLSWTNNGDLQNPANINIKGPPGPGGIPGGTTGQLLAKSSDEDYDTEWIDQPEMDAGHVSYDSTEAYSDDTVGKELGTINSALSSLSSVTEIIDTASGAIASFPDGSGLPMRSLVAQIEPQQDLHGYDAPWAGGSGKNKFNKDDVTTSAYINASGVITPATGSGDEIKCYSGLIPVVAGSITYSGTTNATAPTWNRRLHAYDSSGNWVQQLGYTQPAGTSVVNFEINATVPSGISYVRISGLTNDTNVQVELASSKTSYQPYSNECPISGWTGLSGERCGKNLIDHTQNESGGIDASGNEVSGTTFRRSSNYIPIKPNTSFALWANNNWTVRLYFYDANKNFIPPRKEGGTGGEAIATSPSNAYFARWSVYNAGSAFTNDDIINSQLQLEVGSSATAYEPYITPTTITVSWQSEAGTVYGGTVDVVTGLLTADMGIKTGLWKNFTNEVVADTDLIRRQVNISSAKGDTVNADKMISNIAPYVKVIADKSVHVSMASSGNYVYAILPPTTDPDLEITFCYPLATPQTYQLTPQQILTLLGNNTVFVDTGSVSVTYQASIKGYIDKVLAS